MFTFELYVHCIANCYPCTRIKLSMVLIIVLLVVPSRLLHSLMGVTSNMHNDEFACLHRKNSASKLPNHSIDFDLLHYQIKPCSVFTNNKSQGNNIKQLSCIVKTIFIFNSHRQYCVCRKVIEFFTVIPLH